MPCVNVDCVVDPQELSLREVRGLSALEPFGMGNPQPVFLMNDVRIEEITPISHDRHIKLHLSRQGKYFYAFVFGMGAKSCQFVKGDLLDIVFSAEINSYRGNESTQLVIKDVRWAKCEEQADREAWAVYRAFTAGEVIDREGAAVNVAMFAGHEYFRKAAGAEDIYAGSTEAQLTAMEEGITKALEDGCVGVSFGLRYVPGAGKEEFFRAAKCCEKSKKLIASHLRDDADGVFAAIDEFCAAGVEYGLPVQISHIGSMGGFGQMQQLDSYKLGGLDIAMDCYPYFAFSTRLGTPTYDPGWLDRYHCGYDVLEFCEGIYKGQRATKETFDEMRRDFPQCITVCYVMKEEDIRLAFRHPAVMVGSDGLMNNGQGHPRAAGSFPRFLAEFSRNGDIRLYDAVEMITATPANRLGLAAKGRLNVGADADITIFDYETIRDGATFAQPNLPPQGIEYVLLGGEVVLEKGTVVKDNCGKAVRK